LNTGYISTGFLMNITPETVVRSWGAKPKLFHRGNWFPLAVVLLFTVIAVCSAAILSRLVDEWPAYPKPLQGYERAT
jgi:hypothetical protein